MEYSTKGKHILVDFWGVNEILLDNKKLLHAYLTIAAELTGATLNKEITKKFNPSGVTILGLLSESHISIHTYPSYGYCSVDIYTCGEDKGIDPQHGIDYLIEVLHPEKYDIKRIERGIGNMKEY